MHSIYDLDFNDWVGYFMTSGEKSFRAKQVCSWIYQQNQTDFLQMTDIIKPLREQLCQDFCSELPEIIEDKTASDRTRKLLLRFSDGESVESVMIPEKDRLTLCLSTQIGCAVGCRYCVTARVGFIRNLQPSEIIGQFLKARSIAASENAQITNVVLMGMGEALLNYDNVLKSLHIFTDTHMLDFSKRRITLSTSGNIPGLEKLSQTPYLGSITISLGGAFQNQREYLIPAGKEYSLEKITGFCRNHRLLPRLRYTFAYVMIRDFNDSEKDALELCRILRNIPCKINLIPYNENPVITEFRTPDSDKIDKFSEILAENHYTVLVRKSRGTEIEAACGMLRAGHETS